MKKSQAKNKIPFILDTDMSPDSWVAVLFAALHPRADLLAVSVSGSGEAHGPTGARNAQRLLSLAGRMDVPVGYGPPKPLRGKEHFPLLMRIIIDRMLFKRPPKPADALPVEDSIGLISRLLREADEPITFAAVGPQTNLATVLLKYPELKSKVKGVYIMGGALDVPGNIKEIAAWKTNTTAEWNFFCDPFAAKTVLESGVPVWLVPLDATNQVPVTPDFLGRLRSVNLTPAGEYVYKMLDLMVVKLRAGTNFYLWDPITTACALDPTLAKFKERRVDVVRTKGREWGRVIDAPECAPVNVAGKLDGKRFEETVIKVLSQ
jgi:pyrimidine-specific ribonucleoside hydrolase